jgi:hypothetical protein
MPTYILPNLSFTGDSPSIAAGRSALNSRSKCRSAQSIALVNTASASFPDLTSRVHFHGTEMVMCVAGESETARGSGVSIAGSVFAAVPRIILPDSAMHILSSSVKAAPSQTVALFMTRCCRNRIGEVAGAGEFGRPAASLGLQRLSQLLGVGAPTVRLQKFVHLRALHRGFGR